MPSWTAHWPYHPVYRGFPIPHPLYTRLERTATPLTRIFDQSGAFASKASSDSRHLIRSAAAGARIATDITREQESTLRHDLATLHLLLGLSLHSKHDVRPSLLSRFTLGASRGGQSTLQTMLQTLSLSPARVTVISITTLTSPTMRLEPALSTVLISHPPFTVCSRAGDPLRRCFELSPLFTDYNSITSTLKNGSFLIRASNLLDSTRN